VRIQDVQQGVGEFGVIVFDALGNACAEQREGFDQALDMRILAAFGIELEATGNLGVAIGELAAVAAQVSQFAFVIGQQILHVSWSPAGDAYG